MKADFVSFAAHSSEGNLYNRLCVYIFKDDAGKRMREPICIVEMNEDKTDTPQARKILSQACRWLYRGGRFRPSSVSFEVHSCGNIIREFRCLEDEPEVTTEKEARFKELFGNRHRLLPIMCDLYFDPDTGGLLREKCW